jgi:glycosyltransferase involved in cell wall biosynthesis
LDEKKVASERIAGSGVHQAASDYAIETGVASSVSAVLVSHPHVASFSVGVAGALARAGRLSLFATGVAATEAGLRGRSISGLARQWPVLRNRLLRDVPRDRLRSLAAVELGARAVAKLGAVRTYDALFVAHDAAVAAMPWPRVTDAVYAYEDGALRTFAKAHRRGNARIWDLPLPHYQTIAELWRQESARWPDAVTGGPPVEPLWKCRRKDRELLLATEVVAASRFTKRSLDRIEVDKPVHVVPYGFPVDAFAARSAPPDGPFRVLAVGTQDLRKGTPYLLEAWRRAALRDSELHLIGPLRLAKPFLDRYAGLFRHSAHVPKSELPHHYAAADLLAFPTLGDGFGLVMQEAMCTGTPVVTTTCGGGPECITDGEDGWVVPPGDVDALVERLRAVAANRANAFAVGRAARERAMRWTWYDAGQALLSALRMG